MTAVRAVIGGYARTLLVPLAAVPALLAGWILADARGWIAAVGAVAGWALLTGAWLRRRGRPEWQVQVLSWIAPVIVLAPLLAAGWLSPGGLVLWGPMAGVGAVALACAQDPRFSLAEAAVDPLAQQVDVPHVAGVLPDHPDQHLAQGDGSATAAVLVR